MIPINPMKKKSSNQEAPLRDMTSERLVESINMVRELLKSNKELREKLEQSNQRNDEKDLEIFEIIKENQVLKEKVQGHHDRSPAHSQTAIRSSTGLARKRHSSSSQRTQQYHSTEQQVQFHPRPQTQNLVGTGGCMGFSAGGSRNNFNYWNSVEINQYIN
jgi:hypothetical protein